MKADDILLTIMAAAAVTFFACMVAILIPGCDAARFETACYGMLYSFAAVAVAAAVADFID